MCEKSNGKLKLDRTPTYPICEQNKTEYHSDRNITNKSPGKKQNGVSIDRQYDEVCDTQNTSDLWLSQGRANNRFRYTVEKYTPFVTPYPLFGKPNDWAFKNKCSNKKPNKIPRYQSNIPERVNQILLWYD